MVATKTCFVACPIGEPDSDERKRSDGVLRHILKPVLDDLSYEIIRADQIQTAGRITTQVLQALNDADIVIADLTGENPNVMYELGIRHAIRKPFIHMMENNSKPPFDIYDVRTVFYRLELDTVEDAKSELKGQIESIENGGWSAASPVTFIVPQSSDEDNEQAMIANLHQINSRMAIDLFEMKENINLITNIVSVLYNTREQDREDKNNALTMQFFGQLMTAAIQNPDSLQALVALGNQTNQEPQQQKRTNSNKNNSRKPS
ncbi:MAG: hypothetical protein KAF91_17480 [Nostoc sp. TH1S01]|nr:hypothetical protein [Nostoc sp. TH1S01]